MESLVSFAIVLILGAVLVPLLRDIFGKNYSFYLQIAIAVAILIFFLVRFPYTNPCLLITSIWTILVFPLRPFGLIAVVLLLVWSEAFKELCDDRDGAKAKGSRKKIKQMLGMLLVILFIISMPLSSTWLARQLNQTDQIIGENFIDYVPSATGLLATTRVIETALPTLFNPFPFCPPR